MRADRDRIVLSPTDLADHLGCRHLTQLELLAARDPGRRVARYDPFLEVLQRRGDAHEQEYVGRLSAEGRSVVDLRSDQRLEATCAAMRDGIDVIVQPLLEHGGWRGRADVLRRVEASSELGDWSYEVVDTKLAAETKAGTLLQLLCYAELVSELQGVMSRWVHVVTPLEEQSYETARYGAYTRWIRRRLGAAIEGGDETYPDPVPRCDTCNWWTECDRRRRADDHLCLVAGMQTLHVRELGRQGVTTLSAFAGLEALPESPAAGSVATFDKLRHQARLQVAARGGGPPPFDVLEIEDGRGLTRLPKPCSGDVFLDFEGDPFAMDGGLEYLTGWCWRGEDGALRYERVWAMDRSAERRALERFLGFVEQQWDHWPDFHVYHFGEYEASALKRLVPRHDTGTELLDRLLRGGRLIDLHKVVREGFRIGVERYGLKELEALSGYDRAQDLRDAALARRSFELALGLEELQRIDATTRETIERYNREDCESTLWLRDWLEARRAEEIGKGSKIPRPLPAEDEASESVSERDARIAELAARLREGVPDDPGERNEEQIARALLADLVGYFRREDRCQYWEKFRLRDLEMDGLFEDREALAGLEFVEVLPKVGKARNPVHRYRFEPQECALKVGDAMCSPAVFSSEIEKIGTVQAIDLEDGILDVKMRGDTAHLHPTAVYRDPIVKAKALEESLLAFAGSVIEHGFEGAAEQLAPAVDLLLRRPPRRGEDTGYELVEPGEHASTAALRLVSELEGGVLAIQGPPGSGKTYTGSRMIATLVKQGARVGVTAVSHKVIENLLCGVAKAAETDEFRVDVELVHKTRHEPGDSRITATDDNGKALDAISPGTVVGGTAWLWSRDEAVGALDYLFVDEAGQMSLASVLAVSRAAKNVVLLGDPQQLDQPSRAAHPGGSDVAALVHLVGTEHKTLQATQGLFLDETYRLCDPICELTSEQFYEDRLQPAAGAGAQRLVGEGPFNKPGLHLIEVAHEGNQASSQEEVVEAVRTLNRLLETAKHWIDDKGEKHDFKADDILVVAPYNAQVAKLRSALNPLGIHRVGTVDKFQGQEAPVVLYSCTSSSPVDAPRGMSFLYDPHRFNVATSRARCSVILLASPALFEPECRSPEQVEMANVFCRYRELARSDPQ
ncbi:MAG: TM0106 family RecB-like putative nuclease [Planctomycetota bacterium]